MLKKVYICAPLCGDIERNIENVKRYTRYALLCGTAPVVPHYYALSLDDNNETEREIGMTAGLAMLWFCDEMWIFSDEITKGMESELRFCRNLYIPMKKISEKALKKVLEVDYDEKNS